LLQGAQKLFRERAHQTKFLLEALVIAHWRQHSLKLITIFEATKLF